MSLLAASDLDQTLVFSERSSARDVADLVAVEEYEGRTISWVTPRAWALLADLVATGDFLPVTTRTPAQYARIRWPAAPPRLAVCANGGVLLVDGVADAAWTAQVRGNLAAAQALPAVHDVLARLAAELQALVPGSGDPAVRSVEGLFAYVVLREGQRPPLEGPRLGELTALLDGWGYGVSLQGRKLYAVPRALTKSAAVAEVVRRRGARGFVGAGDSLLDVDLLLAAERAWRPGHGELLRSGWDDPGVVLVDAAGAAAGEVIAEQLLLALR
ncbi:HAD family hydrolase [Kineococcus rubinsiae]|uniref:HAD family hydrolase n=1 Tax=Kineococcus rubinsiae TaxID=2609562 RepID=UPI001430461D|nr:HAD family hydrolase [Kineococcus rubinsiae]NIZ92681.1 HAD family hydrolase [Kineococcus rubinsiae]